mmetsp:Transcript_65476/g.180818  ORF Transcript_65476/g.180818 Transcript_65476/m.180818 type:complete len:100 (+) Transcript_65476:128-427(+)
MSNMTWCMPDWGRALQKACKAPTSEARADCVIEKNSCASSAKKMANSPRRDIDERRNLRAHDVELARSDWALPQLPAKRPAQRAERRKGCDAAGRGRES